MLPSLCVAVIGIVLLGVKFINAKSILAYLIPKQQPFTVCFIKASDNQNVFSVLACPSHTGIAHPLFDNHFAYRFNDS
jgi:hypothetical protein